MRPIVTIVGGILIISLLLSGTVLLSYVEGKQAPFLIKKIIKVHNGYGYQIFKKDRLLIQQEFIPAIKSALPFQSANDAKKVANLVIQKLSSGESPVITRGELDTMNVVILKKNMVYGY